MEAGHPSEGLGQPWSVHRARAQLPPHAPTSTAPSSPLRNPSVCTLFAARALRLPSDTQGPRPPTCHAVFARRLPAECAAPRRTEKWLKFDNSYFTTIPDPKAGPTPPLRVAPWPSGPVTSPHGHAHVAAACESR